MVMLRDAFGCMLAVRTPEAFWTYRILYLHFGLDLWFEKIKPQCRGETYLLRFADGFMASFQFRKDVAHFQKKVRDCFAEFGLELAEEKTRRILFGCFAGVTCLRHGLGRPETFEVLGFKHVCGVDLEGRFALIHPQRQESEVPGPDTRVDPS
jgi:RNA-directed DNA polymerase